MSKAKKNLSQKTRNLLSELKLLLRDEHPDVKIPKGGFNMDYWRSETDCGTVGCALGWGTMLLPSYRKLFVFVDITGLVSRNMSTRSHAMGLTETHLITFSWAFIIAR